MCFLMTMESPHNSEHVLYIYVCMPTVTTRSRGGPTHVGAASNRYSLKFFGLVQCWRTFFNLCAQIADNFPRNSFACGKPKVQIPHFQLFLWCHSAVIGWRLGQLSGWPALVSRKISRSLERPRVAQVAARRSLRDLGHCWGLGLRWRGYIYIYRVPWVKAWVA